jgi:hypothetical protein
MARIRLAGNAGKEAVQGVEVHTDLAPEIVREPDLHSLAEDEVFMNEEVVVLIHPSAGENDVDHIVLSVNGTTQPIFRNVPTRVKRKYVEVLAHMVETKYSQPTRDGMNPEAGNQLIARSAFAYPFEIVEDKNPRGRAWLERLRAFKG